VSVMTRKRPVGAAGSMRDRAAARARRVAPAAMDQIPLAKQAVPFAKDTTEAMRHSADQAAAWAKPHIDDAATWAKPHIDDVRSWAAPRLERSAVAVQDTIAPAISDAMVSAARKIDVRPDRKRRRVAGAIAGAMMLAAAVSAAAAVIMRRRPATFAYVTEEPDEGEVSATPGATAAPHLADGDGSTSDAEANGRVRRS
jgi:hypothetical protein